MDEVGPAQTIDFLAGGSGDEGTVVWSGDGKLAVVGEIGAQQIGGRLGGGGAAREGQAKFAALPVQKGDLGAGGIHDKEIAAATIHTYVADDESGVRCVVVEAAARTVLRQGAG